MLENKFHEYYVDTNVTISSKMVLLFLLVCKMTWFRIVAKDRWGRGWPCPPQFL